MLNGIHLLAHEMYEPASWSSLNVHLVCLYCEIRAGGTGETVVTLAVN